MLSKHFLLSLLIGLLALGNLTAQSATFELPSASGNPGDVVCLPVTVLDFSDIVEFGFTLTWDEDALDFVSVNNLNPLLNNFNQVNVIPGSGIRGVNTFTTSAGALTAYWRRWNDGQTCQSLPTGLDLPDDAVLFEVCFTIRPNAYGTIHEVNFFNAPQPLTITKKISGGICTLDAILGTMSGDVTVGVDPLILSIEIPEGNFQPGDLMCVDVVAESGFANMQGLQFALDWDRSVLQVESVIPNEDIPNNSEFIYNVNQASNCVSAVWSYTLPGAAITLAPNTVFTSVCFRITGGCNSATPIEVSSSCNNAPIEAINDFDSNGSGSSRIPVVTNDSRFRVQNCNNFGLDVMVGCGEAVELGDEVCVAIKAGTNFTSISEFAYLIRFDRRILQYNRTRNYLTMLGMNVGDFDADNVANGILGVDWNSSPFPPVTVAEGITLYEVCFDVVGYTESTPITISDPSNVVESNPALTLIGVDAMNCEVDMIEPDRVVLTFGSGGIASTADQCLPVTVANFVGVTQLGFTLQYDVPNDLFDYQSLANQALPGATITPLGAGLLLYSWSGTAVTIPDGGLLFELCLRAKDAAIPAECSPIGISTFPLPPSASNASNTVDGIIDIPGEGCVLFPEGFGVTFGSDSTVVDSSVCIPVTVESFDNITSANFSINFDPAGLSFLGFQLDPMVWPGLAVANFNTSGAALGVVTLNWTSTGGPLAIPDGATAFNICFNTGLDPDCYDIFGSAASEPTATTSAGNGSILFTEGEICVDDRIQLNDFIVLNEPACPDQCNGQLVLLASVSSFEAGDIFVRVDNPFQTRAIRQTANNPVLNDTIRNLCPGWVYFTIFNDGDPDLTYRDSVFIEFDDTQVVTAMAGPDRELGCTNNPVVSINSRGNVGVTFDLFRLVGGNLLTIPGAGGNINPDGSYSYFTGVDGTYILEVFNAAGCSAFDTVVVNPPRIPMAVAGPDTVLTCQNTSIVLTGEGSATDGVVGYRWERLAGGVVVDTVGTELELTVTEAGVYQLVVTYLQTQCTASDRVTVSNNGTPPDVNLPTLFTLACDGSSAMLDAGTPQPGIEYTWRNGAGTIVSNNSLFETSELGAYTLTVFDPTSGCTTVLNTEVAPSTGAPVITLPTTRNLNCSSDTLVLVPEVANASGSTTYSWTTVDGRIVIGQADEMSPEIVGPGTYELIVDNGGCTDSTSILILPSVNPVADAGDDINLECNQSLTIDGSGSQADNATYLWFTMNDTINGETTNQLTVSQPGFYVIEVTDVNTACQNTDTIEVLAPLGFPVVAMIDTIFGLSCNNDTVSLTPVVDVNGGNYSLAIAGPGAPVVDPNDPTSVLLFAAGEFTLTVTNDDNGCTSETAFLVDDGLLTPPFAALTQAMTSISCESPSVILNGSLSSRGENFTYLWTSADGGETPLTPENDSLTVSTGGRYIFTVTNTLTGCSSSDEIIVSDTRVFPQFDTLAVEPLTCNDRVTTVGIAIGDTTGFTIQWLGQGGLIATNVFTIEVTAGGTYSVVVINNQTSCVTNESIRVIDEANEVNEIIFAAVDTITCEVGSVQIDASASLSDPGLVDTIRWTSLDGNTVTPATGSLIVDVDGAGDYILTLATADGCSVSDTINVAFNNTAEEIVFAPVDPFDCSTASVTIDASASLANPASAASITWTSLNGNTITPASGSLTVSANGAGEYVLTIVTQGGCEVTDTLLVPAANNTPFADAGADQAIACGEEVILGGPNTSVPALDTFMFTWISVSGGSIISGADQPTAMASGIGTYELLVVNIYNFCEDRDTVTITLADQELAMLPANFSTCEDSATIMGNLPQGTTGAWTTIAGGADATIVSIDNVTTIDGLTGSISLTYTLSAPGCENYSTDTITVTREETPVAIDDNLLIVGNMGVGSINLLANDQRTGPVTVTLLDDAPFGDVIFLNGDFTLDAGAGISGEFTLRYQICSNTCPDLCDEGLLNVRVDADGERPPVYNAITPNGDGMNDAFIFDILSFNPDEYPDNELVIFNRWGDILYEAKPYNNDWTGVNNSGQDIPEGTYYYILRLNLGEGDIIRGDITVIR